MFAIGQYFEGSVHDFELSGNNECDICHKKNKLRVHYVYTLYQSPSINAIIYQPQSGSKECLECHNGLNISIPSLSQCTNFGMNLSNHHPISLKYDDNLAFRDGELHFPSSRMSGMGSTIENDLLNGGMLECVSCHDVHGSQFPHLLKISNYRSALCLTCHNK